jgi:predicted nucleotidyltransferase
MRIEMGEKVGKAVIRGRVLKSDPFDFPSIYVLDNGVTVLSFTHTFSGQAFDGENVEARGVLEIVNGKRYLIVGSYRDTADEYVVSLDLLEGFDLLEDFLRWKFEMESERLTKSYIS